MAAICQNCQKSIECSCQRRVASDGKSCCTNCLSTYEFKLKSGKDTNFLPPQIGPKNVTIIRQSKIDDL